MLDINDIHVISIHTPLAGSDVDMLDINDIHVISIHTPLAGSDRKTLKTSANSWNFNPHSPCGERRVPLTYASCICQFQSTLPLRGATPPAQADGPRSNHFNPHSPCGERRRRWSHRRLLCNFNPHSPCGERRCLHGRGMRRQVFQSTLPLRGATHVVLQRDQLLLRISIHTPLAGSDRDEGITDRAIDISIHTPLAGSDLPATIRIPYVYNFNPHSPCGERHDTINQLVALL